MRITYYHFPTLDSTNSFARRLAPKLEQDELAVISAEEQTGGYGRLHRAWASPKGTSLACTFLFFQNDLPLFAFSQLASLVCYEMCASLHPRIKWPNDLLINGQKITGILTETTSVADQRAILLGVGMNINTTRETLAMIPRKTTSWLIETGQEHSIQALQELLVQGFYKGLSRSASEIQHEWQEKVTWMLGTHAEIQVSGKTASGTIHNIEPDGTLTLQLQDGTLQQIFSGEITG